MNDKTIIYIGGFELPDKNAAAHRVLSNAKILRNLRYNVVLIGVDKSLNAKTDFLESKQEVDGFTTYALPYPKGIIQWFKYLSDISFIDKIQLDVKHIILYNYPALALYRFMLYAKKRGIGLSGDVTEWYAPQGNILFRIIKGADVHFRMRWLHPRLDGLIVISDYLANYYKNSKAEVINIPPLVDLSLEKWQYSNEVEKSVNDNIVLTYAGSVGTGKKDRIDRIIKAISVLKSNRPINIEFNVIGLTREEYSDIFEIKGADEDFVAFRGKVTHDEVIKYLQESDFSIFLRNKNLTNEAGFPTKFVEAISAGTPVLANSISNIDGFLIEAKTGFIINNNTFDDLLESLNNILSLSKSEIKILKNNCKNNRTFHYENYCQRFKDFFDNL